MTENQKEQHNYDEWIILSPVIVIPTVAAILGIGAAMFLLPADLPANVRLLLFMAFITITSIYFLTLARLFSSYEDDEDTEEENVIYVDEVQVPWYIKAGLVLAVLACLYKLYGLIAKRRNPA